MEFTAGSCIRFGWETFNKRPWFLVGANLLFIVVLGIISVILGEVGNIGPMVSAATGLANWIVQIIAGMGMINFMLKAHDDIEHVALSDFWRPEPFWRYLGASTLQILAVIGGVILLVIPGIIFGIMFGLVGYLTVDRGLSPMAAMRESKRMTDGHKWTLLLLGFFSMLIVILGLLCLLVGILVASPVVALAFAHAYRTLSKQPEPVPVTV